MTSTASLDTSELPLADLLRVGSRAEHTDAEESTFITALMGGRVGRRGYAAYLSQLWHAYAALEDVGRALSDEPLAAAVIDPALARVPAIERDLSYWGLTEPAPATTATMAYVARLRSSAEWGGLFLAHHYTRYLGDLSGGQVVGAGLARIYRMERKGEGLEFYRFADIAKPKPYKDAYRARLNELPVDAAGKQRILGEVRVAFTCNRQLFGDLEQYVDTTD